MAITVVAFMWVGNGDVAVLARIVDRNLKGISV
jgi:hypothetical protein